MRKRLAFSDLFKAVLAREALRAVTRRLKKAHQVATQVSTWTRQAIKGMAGVFSDKIKKAEAKNGEIKERHAKICQRARLGVQTHLSANGWRTTFFSQGLKPLPGNPAVVCIRARWYIQKRFGSWALLSGFARNGWLFTIEARVFATIFAAMKRWSGGKVWTTAAMTCI